MNKTEFLKTIVEAREAIRIANRTIHDAMNSYREECCPFKVGDKLKITSKNWHKDAPDIVEFGWVESISVTDKGDFYPHCAACKKDGTKHARNKIYPHIGSIIKIEKV